MLLGNCIVLYLNCCFNDCIYMQHLRVCVTRRIKLLSTHTGNDVKIEIHLHIYEQVPSLIQLCYDFLSHFNSDNCLHFYSIAIKYGLNDLKQKILDYIKSHIAEIENGNAFSKMDYDTFVIVAGLEFINFYVYNRPILRCRLYVNVLYACANSI